MLWRNRMLRPLQAHWSGQQHPMDANIHEILEIIKYLNQINMFII